MAPPPGVVDIARLADFMQRADRCMEFGTYYCEWSIAKIKRLEANRPVAVANDSSDEPGMEGSSHPYCTQ